MKKGMLGLQRKKFKLNTATRESKSKQRRERFLDQIYENKKARLDGELKKFGPERLFGKIFGIEPCEYMKAKNTGEGIQFKVGPEDYWRAIRSMMDNPIIGFISHGITFRPKEGKKRQIEFPISLVRDAFMLPIGGKFKIDKKAKEAHEAALEGTVKHENKHMEHKTPFTNKTDVDMRAMFGRAKWKGHSRKTMAWMVNEVKNWATEEFSALLAEGHKPALVEHEIKHEYIPQQQSYLKTKGIEMKKIEEITNNISTKVGKITGILQEPKFSDAQGNLQHHKEEISWIFKNIDFDRIHSYLRRIKSKK